MSMPRFDTIWTNARLMCCEKDISIVENAAIGITNGHIAWIGSSQDASKQNAKQLIDVENRLITPGFIDCHTHLVYAGNRADEFAMQLQGVSYADIAESGGGIQSTVRHTRKASFDELLKVSKARALECIANGITTIEIKSGYGLDLENEIKMLRVARQLAKELPIRIRTTFLGAHTVPTEYQGRATDYIHFLCKDVLPIIAEEKLADSIDIFCEHLAFNLEQATILFEHAKKYQLPIKCHAEQLSSFGATRLAAEYQALSVDHLEYLTEKDVKALAKTNAVAVLLPGAFYFLREKQLPPIALLRQYNIPIAIASDHNPGTSPILSLLTIMNMGATLFSLTPEELFLGVTKHAAHALELSQECGTLTVGKSADFAIWDVASPIELCYYIKKAPLFQRVFAGKITMK